MKILLFSVLFVLTRLPGQEPRFVSPVTAQRPLRGSLAAELRTSPGDSPRWIAWIVAQPREASHPYCYWDHDPPAPRTVHLEGVTRAVVMVRLDPHAYPRIRAFPLDCEIDTGEVPLTLLENVTARDSIAALEPFLENPDDRARSALRAIAAHEDPAANAILERIANTPNAHLRGTALSLLGSHRGARGFDVLRQQPPSRETFSAIASNRDPRAVPWLIEAVRSAATPTLRKEAVRALTRVRDPRATAFLEQLASR